MPESLDYVCPILIAAQLEDVVFVLLQDALIDHLFHDILVVLVLLALLLQHAKLLGQLPDALFVLPCNFAL